jgi:hypothetical protein
MTEQQRLRLLLEQDNAQEFNDGNDMVFRTKETARLCTSTHTTN